MVFSSLIFIFLFFTLTMVAYWLAPNLKAKNWVLLLASLIFYAWGGPAYLFLLLGMTAISWLGSLSIEHVVGQRAKQKRLLILTICLQLALLAYFKYTGLFLTTLKNVTGWPEHVLQVSLPIGISFYTFQLITYTVDVYRQEAEAQKSYWMVLLYAALFFQCIAGPIVRYQDVADEIATRQARWPEISRGISRFSVGLFKKAVLANSAAVLADQLCPLSVSGLRETSALGIWLGLLMYMVQIYLDFSAYSDMAIGMGWMVGFHFKENFNYPYIAQSITDFWRRWHISLSSFFRDYVYIPLGGNRRGARRQIFNMLVVWSLTGFWHGAHWNYLFWGLYFFIFLVLEKWVLKLATLPSVLKHAYLLIIVYFGWLLFRFTSFELLMTALKGMFAANGNGWLDMTTKMIFTNNLFLIIVTIIACFPWARNLYRWVEQKVAIFAPMRFCFQAIDILAPTAIILIGTMTLVGNSYNPFLYFQF